MVYQNETLEKIIVFYNKLFTINLILILTRPNERRKKRSNH